MVSAGPRWAMRSLIAKGAGPCLVLVEAGLHRFRDEHQAALALKMKTPDHLSYVSVENRVPELLV